MIRRKHGEIPPKASWVALLRELVQMGLDDVMLLRAMPYIRQGMTDAEVIISLALEEMGADPLPLAALMGNEPQLGGDRRQEGREE